jgi:WD40 repeat protein
VKSTNFLLAVNFALLMLILGTGFCHAEDTPRLVLKGHSKPVVDVQFATDGKTFASMSADGETILWDLSAGSGRRVPSLSRSLVAGSYLQFTMESPELLLAGSGGQGFLIDPTKGETIAEYGDRKQLNSGPIAYLGGRRVLVGNNLVQEIGKAGNLFEVPNMTSSVVEAGSPNGNIWVTNRRFLSAGDRSNRLELIDLSTGKASGELPKFANIWGVAWVDNQHLLVLHAPGTLTLWETTPKVRLIAKQEIDGTLLTTSFTGKVAAVSIDKNEASIFDITNDAIRLRRTVTAQSPIQLSGDGSRLLSAGTAYQSYTVTDTSTGAVLLADKWLEGDLFPKMTADGQDIVVGHADGTITFQPVGQPIATPLKLVADLPLKMPPDTKAHPKFLDSFRFEDGEIVFSPKGDACVTHTPGSVNKSMTIADFKPGSSHFPVWYAYGTARQAKLESWAFTPESVLFVDYQRSGTPSETWFLSATVDPGSGRLVINTAQGPRPSAILGFGINPDQKSIVALAGEYDRKHTGSSSIVQSADYVVLEYPSGKLVKTLAKDVDPISSPRIAFSSSGQRVAMLVKHKIQVWDIQSGEELILGEDLNYGRFWLIDGGRTLVVPGTYGTMRGIDLETNEDAFVWSPEDRQSGKPSAIDFSHDGKYALCGSSTGEVTLRDSHTGTVLLRHAAFEGAVAAVGISRDSSQIAAANSDRTLRVWKLGTIINPETVVTKTIEVDSGK